MPGKRIEMTWLDNKHSIRNLLVQGLSPCIKSGYSLYRNRTFLGGDYFSIN